MLPRHIRYPLGLILASLLLASCASGQGTPVKAPELGQPLAFGGEQGQKVAIANGQIRLDANGSKRSATFGDSSAHYYNTQLASGKTVYFFVVKDQNGVYRAAANACQVCYASRMGFRQEGDFMVCNTCGNRYPVGKIATEKGGCNPVPISPNLQVKDGQLIIKEVELTPLARFFS